MSEPKRYSMEGYYYFNGTGELKKAAESYELSQQRRLEGQPARYFEARSKAEEELM